MARIRAVILNDSICGASLEFPGHPEVGEVIVAGYGDEATCLDSFSPGEQAASLATLPELPNARFTSEPEEVGDRNADGDRGGIALMLLVGPIQGVGDRVEVPASSVCGQLCGRLMTFVIERQGDGWEVTGFTGPVGMA